MPVIVSLLSVFLFVPTLCSAVTSFGADRVWSCVQRPCVADLTLCDIWLYKCSRILYTNSRHVVWLIICVVANKIQEYVFTNSTLRHVSMYDNLVNAYFELLFCCAHWIASLGQTCYPLNDCRRLACAWTQKLETEDDQSMINSNETTSSK